MRNNVEPKKLGTHQFGKDHCKSCMFLDPLKHYSQITGYCRRFREYLYPDPNSPETFRGVDCKKDEVKVGDILYPQMKGRYYVDPPKNTSC